MAAPGFTIVVRFPYRGADEEWSQQYHITGSAPADDAAWATLEAAVLPEFRLALTDICYVVRFYGYADTDDDAAFVDDLEHGTGALQGEFVTGSDVIAPGDAAAWCRWKTGRLNSRGKPIYLRKYFHGVPLVSGTAGGEDVVLSGYRDALQTFADDMVSGLGGLPVIADPAGRAPDGPQAVSHYVTTRTLKRRGPRPH